TDDPRPASRPRRLERTPAALALEAQELHPGQLGDEPARDERGGVRARVVGDDDAPGEGELGGEEAVEAADALLERRLLVVHRDDDVDLRSRPPSRVGTASEGGGRGDG